MGWGGVEGVASLNGHLLSFTALYLDLSNFKFPDSAKKNYMVFKSGHNMQMQCFVIIFLLGPSFPPSRASLSSFAMDLPPGLGR